MLLFKEANLSSHEESTRQRNSLSLKSFYSYLLKSAKRWRRRIRVRHKEKLPYFNSWGCYLLGSISPRQDLSGDSPRGKDYP